MLLAKHLKPSSKCLIFCLSINCKLKMIKMPALKVQDLLFNLPSQERQGIRKEIGEMIHVSTSAYDVRCDYAIKISFCFSCSSLTFHYVRGLHCGPCVSRLEAQSKMSMMREKAVKDLAQYNTEMKELERVIAHEQDLKEFMTAKCSERSAQDEGQEMGRRQCRTLGIIFEIIEPI